MRALLAAVSTFLPAASLLATTITVNSLTDASGCSLRNAIVAANTNAASGGCTAGSGADDISVAVAGTYAPASPLPEISSIVTITATTGNFELNGANAGAADGIRFVSGSAGSRLTGLVINGFSGSGVVLNTSGITLTQNRIGTDRFGVSPIPNCSGAPSSAGVLVDGVIHQTNVIGGSSSTDRNLISGNACIGVRVVTGAATISNNYIGTDYTGSNAIPNGDKGVAIETTSDNRVTNNVLSGNTVAQIIVASGRLHLEGNLIGSNAAGTARLANAPFADGVRALGAGAIVTVVFNRFVGLNDAVLLEGVTGVAGSSSIGGNRIGEHARGESTIPNVNGIHLRNAAAAQISGNTVVGGTGYGMWLEDSSDVWIHANDIGVIYTVPTVVAPNLEGAIRIAGNSNRNTLGPMPFQGGANRIAYNRASSHAPAIAILGGTGNKVTKNSIWENSGALSSLPVDLGGDGPTPNDACDVDAGPNNRLNAPFVTSALPTFAPPGPSSFAVHVRGMLEAGPNTTYTIEFFSNPTGSPTPQQAQRYLGSVVVTTGADCIAPFDADIGQGEASLQTGETIVAFTIASNGDTSEGSAPASVAGQRSKGDFDRDGKTDLVLRNYVGGANAIWFMTDTAIREVYDLPALPNIDYRLEAAADFDRDGAEDLLFRNYVNGQIAIWKMPPINPEAPASVTSVHALPTLSNSNYHIEGVGDFNLDNHFDIVLRNHATGQNAVWLLNGFQYVSTVDLAALPNTSYDIAGVGEFNGDGNADIVWRNVITGVNAVWLMNGLQLSSIADLPALPNTNYEIQAVGSFYGDTTSELVWRNRVTGQNAFWIFSGSTFLGVIDLPAVSNTNIEFNAPR